MTEDYNVYFPVSFTYEDWAVIYETIYAKIPESRITKTLYNFLANKINEEDLNNNIKGIKAFIKRNNL